MPIQSSKLKIKSFFFRFTIVSVTLSFALLTFNLPPVQASTMSGDSYTIDQQDVQIQPYVREQQKPQEQTIKHFAQGDNFTVDTTTPDAFSFGMSTEHISFGTLQATNPVLRTLTLFLNSINSYQILTAEDHPLRKGTETIIPDTTCDNGSCSPITEALWTNTLTYGFGYRLNTMDPAYFKPFSDILQNHLLSTLASGPTANNHEFTVTYKANISGGQETGRYSNTVTYIATPDF